VLVVRHFGGVVRLEGVDTQVAVSLESGRSGTDPPLSVEALLAGRWQRLVLLAVGVLGSRAAAEDVVQDVFEAVLRGRVVFEGQSRADAYLRTAVVNRCRSQFRRLATHRRYERRHPGGQVVVPPASELYGEHAELLEALTRLPQRQREVLVLRFWCDLPFDQLAAELGLRVSTARSISTRALNKLKVELKENRHG
jgi:RNA polymerase sigma factor (sigma-70 family)